MVESIKRRRGDLLGWPVVSLLLKHPFALFMMRALTMLLLVSAVYFGFTYPTQLQNPYTTAIFWSLFWPFFMIVSLFLLGPAFCGVCPHGTLGRWISRIGRRREMPSWLRRRGIGLGILIFAYWVPVYLFPGLLATPWVAALLFGVLTFGASVMFFLYKEMSYCTYLCPIGAVSKAYGKIGMTRLQTYREACSECKTFDCAAACEAGLQPYLFEKRNSMRDCTLCMECAQACEAVSFSLVPPGSGLMGTINDRHNTHTLVYILIFAVITMTMRFHHGLGHSALKTSLPWYQTGTWLKGFLPAGVDWVGFSALAMALGVTLLLVLGGLKTASALLKTPFRPLLHQSSYALAPMMILGSLSHVCTSFFVHYASDIANAWYWLVGSSETMAPLAGMRDGWVHSFALLGYVGVIWSAWLLARRLGIYAAPAAAKVSAWLAGGAVIWFYSALLVLQIVFARG